MTKRELIDILQKDKSSLDTPIIIYLECANNDTEIYGKIGELTYNKKYKELSIIGTYEENEFEF